MSLTEACSSEVDSDNDAENVISLVKDAPDLDAETEPLSDSVSETEVVFETVFASVGCDADIVRRSRDSVWDCVALRATDAILFECVAGDSDRDADGETVGDADGVSDSVGDADGDGLRDLSGVAEEDATERLLDMLDERLGVALPAVAERDSVTVEFRLTDTIVGVSERDHDSVSDRVSEGTERDPVGANP